MKFPIGSRHFHLSYCTNIHKGETWGETFQNLKDYAAAIGCQMQTENVGVSGFGIGLRLSALAAKQLLNEFDNVSGLRNLQEFQQWLNANNLYVYTINGFPYGRFNEGVIKTDVYKPGWNDAARLEYTKNLIKILATLLPDGLGYGSISTVPLGYICDIPKLQQKNCFDFILEAVRYCQLTHEETGKQITLAIEAEPFCSIETTADQLSFFEMLAPHAEDQGKNPGEIRRYLGVCLDICHMACVFEDFELQLGLLKNAGIRPYKVQISNCLELENLNREKLETLSKFHEATYLHQTFAMDREGNLHRFLDIDEAVQKIGSDFERFQGGMLRSHFHVPIFYDSAQSMNFSQSYLKKALEVLKKVMLQHNGPETDRGSPENYGEMHFEVETYSFDKLPSEFRQHDLRKLIKKELQWALNKLSGDCI